MKPPTFEYGATVKISRKESHGNSSVGKTERKFLASYHAKSNRNANTNDTKNKEVDQQYSRMNLSLTVHIINYFCSNLILDN